MPSVGTPRIDSHKRTTRHACVPRLVGALLAIGVGPCFVPAAAQEIVRVVGIVTDEQTGQTIAGATIQLSGRSASLPQTVSSAAGEFTFSGVAPGEYTLLIRRIGYNDSRTPMRIASNRSAPLTLHLRLTPKAVALDPIDVTVRARPPRLVESGFYRRMEEGWGTYFEPDWIEANTVGYTSLTGFLSNLERRVGESQCRRVPVYHDERFVGTLGNSRTNKRSPRGQLDQRGRSASSPSTLLEELSVAEIGAAEYYSPQSRLPRFAWDGQTMTCGAIILWSDWTTQVAQVEIREETPKIDIELCEPARHLGGRVIDGFVEDEITSVRLPAARVFASYTIGSDATNHAIEVQTNAHGQFRLCNLPLDVEIELVASYGDYRGVPQNTLAPTLYTANQRDVRLVVPVMVPH